MFLLHMTKEKIRKLLEEFEKVHIPNCSDNKELIKIWDEILLFYLDFLGCKKAFIEKKLYKDEIPLNPALEQKLRNFKPLNERDQKCLLKLKRFKHQIDNLLRKMLKELE